jgi:hypothetical protein
MPSDAANQATKREWRELGFFYERDDHAKVWKLTGSRAGLLRDGHAILGLLTDLERLAKLIERKLARARPGSFILPTA